MDSWDTTLPPLLRQLYQLEFDYADGDGIDFIPYGAFLSAEENAFWFKLWTGNPTVDGAQFRIFGQDGTGGYAAFWLIEAEKPLEEQPIVFLGSEGERGVVAVSVDEFLWLLAANIGPYEAVAYPDEQREPNAPFTQFAQEHSKVAQRSVGEIIEHAHATYPEFSQYIDSLCQ